MIGCNGAETGLHETTTVREKALFAAEFAVDMLGVNQVNVNGSLAHDSRFDSQAATECIAIFGTDSDTARTLGEMVYDQAWWARVTYGPESNPLGISAASVSYQNEWIYVNGVGRFSGTTATVNINTASNSPWVTGFPDQHAMRQPGMIDQRPWLVQVMQGVATWLHELDHVYHNVKESG